MFNIPIREMIPCRAAWSATTPLRVVSFNFDLVIRGRVSFVQILDIVHIEGPYELIDNANEGFKLDAISLEKIM